MKKKFVLIITHGNFGIELLKSAEMIMGDQEDAAALGLRLGESVDDLRNKVEEIIVENQKADKDIIILVDIFRRQPVKCIVVYVKKYGNIELITGVNMLMLIEIFQSRESEELDKLIEKAIDSTVNGIKRYNLKGKDSDC